MGATTVGPDTSNSNSNASANTESHSVATGGAGGSSSAMNGAANAGNAQTLSVVNTTPAHQEIKTVPQVYAPALTTTLTETCMGSSSGGASGMGWGVSLGTSWRDQECVRRLDAREIMQLLGRPGGGPGDPVREPGRL